MAEVRSSVGIPSATAFGGLGAPSPGTPIIVDTSTANLYVLIGSVPKLVGGIPYGNINGCYCTYNSASVLGAALGSLDINGVQCANAGAITLTLSGLTTGLNYVYAYNSSGTAWAIECSTTAPVKSASLNGWYKTGDTTRRCIWAIYALTASTMLKFTAQRSGSGRLRSCTFLIDFGASSPDNDFLFINGLASATPTSWASVDMSSIMPVNVLTAKMSLGFFNAGAAPQDCAMVLSETDPGSIPANSAITGAGPYISLGIGESFYGGLGEMTMPVNRALYWCAYGVLSNPDVLGYAIVAGWEMDT